MEIVKAHIITCVSKKILFEVDLKSHPSALRMEVEMKKI
jgi:hypothetical protein